jgi:uncharacterized protein YfcZ (UPF0381/DUF406 family)
MPGTLDESLRTIFESARRNLTQAWEFYRNGQYRPAVKLAAQVEKTARRLIEISNRQQSQRTNFERRLISAKEFIDRIEIEVAGCNSVAASSLIDQAKTSLGMANDLADKGRFEAAVKQLQQARKLASEAADLCGSGSARDMSSALQRLKSEADLIREEIPRDDETAKRLMEQVFSQLENARQFIANQDSQAAAASLRAAQITLRQLRRYLNNGE